jgi:hypothetical protein
VEALSSELARVQPTAEPIVAASPLPLPSPIALQVEAVTDAIPESVLEFAVFEEEEALEAEPVPAMRPTAEPTPAPTRTPFPTRTVRPTSVADAAPCRVGQIKGNKSSHIYHVPGGASYSRTVNNVECFDSEDQAAAAGYRKARN